MQHPEKRCDAGHPDRRMAGKQQGQQGLGPRCPKGLLEQEEAGMQRQVLGPRCPKGQAQELPEQLGPAPHHRRRWTRRRQEERTA